MEIKGMTFQLNNYIEVVFTNSEGHQEIHVGRIFDYDKNRVWIDKDLVFWSLEDTVEIKKDNIKRVRKMKIDWWR